MDSLVVAAGIGTPVGAGTASPVDGAVDGMASGIAVVCGIEEECEGCPDGK